uniref:hypothetical protein n=1 Tax=uncultured Nostoc sp. TaxID=340711 RepID=UPI0035CBBC7F
MTESEIEEFERLKRRIRGDWIAAIQMELIKLDYCAMLVTIDNHEAFLGYSRDTCKMGHVVKFYKN